MGYQFFVWVVYRARRAKEEEEKEEEEEGDKENLITFPNFTVFLFRPASLTHSNTIGTSVHDRYRQ